MVVRGAGGLRGEEESEAVIVGVAVGLAAVVLLPVCTPPFPPLAEAATAAEASWRALELPP